MATEDDNLIERVNRAPDRRVFKIDVGVLAQAEAAKLIAVIRAKLRRFGKKGM